MTAQGWEFLQGTVDETHALWRTRAAHSLGKWQADALARISRRRRTFRAWKRLGQDGRCCQPDERLAGHAVYAASFSTTTSRRLSRTKQEHSAGSLGFCSRQSFAMRFARLTRRLKVTNATLRQSPLRPGALAEGGGGEISARIAEAVFQRPDAMAVQRPPCRCRPAVARGRGAVARLPVAAPDRFQFSRLPGARPGWSGNAGG